MLRPMIPLAFNTTISNEVTCTFLQFYFITCPDAAGSTTHHGILVWPLSTHHDKKQYQRLQLIITSFIHSKTDPPNNNPPTNKDIQQEPYRPL
mmetsp:Transcript_5236/g.7811  ORF Transcript_5236/g.7811 Transcript_5236/m.7811 type:complete len:93 (-) Transcript_5236:9-287(-)